VASQLACSPAARMTSLLRHTPPTRSCHNGRSPSRTLLLHRTTSRTSCLPPHQCSSTADVPYFTVLDYGLWPTVQQIPVSPRHACASVQMSSGSFFTSLSSSCSSSIGNAVWRGLSRQSGWQPSCPSVQIHRVNERQHTPAIDGSALKYHSQYSCFDVEPCTAGIFLSSASFRLHVNRRHLAAFVVERSARLLWLVSRAFASTVF